MFPSPGADHHFDACAVIKSTPCTSSRKLQCALRNQILLRYRHISSLWHSLHKAIPLHLRFALSWCKATQPTHTPNYPTIKGTKLLKLCLLLGGTRIGTWGLDCPLGSTSCCVFPFWRRTWLIYLACTNMGYPESFHKGRGRARVVPGHHAGEPFISRCLSSAAQCKPLHYKITTSWLWTEYQIPLKTLSSLSSWMHQVLLRNKHYIITIRGFFFFFNLTFLIHAHYLEGVTWICKFYVRNKKTLWEACMER